MANNRDLIDNSDILLPEQALERGWSLPGFRNRFLVQDGWQAIILEGGIYKETLDSGEHFLDRYAARRDLRAILVDTRLQPLNIETSREFTIDKPVSVQIDLALSVEYRVCDARRVALEVKTPLTNLFDRVIQAVRNIIGYVTYDEVRRNGEEIAALTLQRLQAMQLPRVLGIEVYNVFVTRIRALDAAGDVIAGRGLKEYETIRDAQVDQALTQGTSVTWEWLLRHRPEIAQQMIANHGMLAKELVEKGLINPTAAVLNQPLGAPPDPTHLLGSVYPAGGSQPAQHPILPASSQDIHARMREEVNYLTNGFPNANVQTKPGTDQQGIPDGSYDLRVQVSRVSGGTIDIYITCPASYPQSPPVAIDVEVNDQPVSFQSSILSRWHRNYLVEIVREVMQIVR